MSSWLQAKHHYRHNQYVVAADEMGAVERLVLLLKGLDEILCRCEGYIETEQPARKGELIGQGMDIFITLKQGLVSTADRDSLDNSLDKRVTDMSEQLNKLYDHCLFLLSRTTLENNLETLTAVRNVVKQLTEAWQVNQSGLNTP